MKIGSELGSPNMVVSVDIAEILFNLASNRRVSASSSIQKIQ